MGPLHSKFSPRAPERTLRRPICSPGSSPRIPVSSQVSGRPHRAYWPPTAPRERSHRPGADPLDFEEFCGGANTLYVCSTGRRQRQFAPLVVAIVGDLRDAAYERSRDGAGRPTDTSGTRRGRQHLPHSRSAGHDQRGCGSGPPRAGLPPGPLPGPRPVGTGGGRIPLALRHHRRPARASPTRRRCATSARWPATGRWPARRSTARSDRWGRIRPSTSVGSIRQHRLPVDAVAHGESGRALVLGTDKEVSEVTLTPAHASSPWRELLPPSRGLSAMRGGRSAAADSARRCHARR